MYCQRLENKISGAEKLFADSRDFRRGTILSVLSATLICLSVICESEIGVTMEDFHLSPEYQRPLGEIAPTISD